MLYSALALLSLFSTAYCQQTQPTVLEVPLASNGNEYMIRFLSTTPLGDVTREFCISNAASLGIQSLTEESLPACQGPVERHIRDYFQAAVAAEPAAQEVVEIQLDVNQQQYGLRFHPTADSILAVSRNFCISNADSLGIQPLTEESLPACQTPVVDHMRAAAVRYLEQKQQKSSQSEAPISVSFTIQGYPVQLSVLPTEESVLAVSRDFCIANAAALRIEPLTEESLPGCQQPVLDALVAGVRQHQQQRQQQVAEVTLTANGNEYQLRFLPTAESILAVSRDFCISNAASLGIQPLTEESLPACQSPVVDYMRAQLSN